MRKNFTGQQLQLPTRHREDFSGARCVRVVITLTDCVFSDLKTVSSGSNICLLQAPSAVPELPKEAIIKDQTAVL